MCSELGLPDDCTELQTLRSFRDSYMLSSPEKASMVKDYYDKAPAVVASLAKLPNRREIYSQMRQQFILPAVDAAKIGNNALALELYTKGIAFVVGFLN